MGDMFGGNEVEQPDPNDNRFNRQLSRMARQLYNQTQPLRTGLLDQYGQVLQGTYDPQTDPKWDSMFSAAKSGLEGQYGNAREAIMSNNPRGGALTSNLANLEMARAKDVGSIPAQMSQSILGDLQNKIYGTAWGAPAQAMGGMGSAAGVYGGQLSAYQAALAQQQASANSSMGMLGSGLGQAGGYILGNKPRAGG